ncbi:ribonucleoside-triphosphate reductase, adenosylcobalamin-dependent [Anaerocolumna xylanovorans]|uniref:Adenosylcobalamin-dependent ribonucleoside-triphosphate reductase n=1 Tax=Anaerocolumna xylanovorans DSM 12503 TaxID=1121345 RepID=A0A1M7Y9Z4_9FIRM|nr:ribonucleoside-triphosphate reductase, adenosylcobalamin-dependent [Anaerocolumna xylanovorans]SHO49453.1 ribonucleoside-diphosphate reductase alpha chain [Anaerocolumna xylanovorans DSM 12503]
MKELLSKEFLSKYMDVESPLKGIGEFIYLRTYSRYINEKGRRENWFETVLRTVNYNVMLGVDYKKKHGIEIDWEEERKEAERFFEALFYLKTFPAGRTLYMGGTDIVKEYPLANYNCCFTTIENLKDFTDVFYLLMLGCGVGVRLEKKVTGSLPGIRKVGMTGRYEEGVRSLLTKEERENTTLALKKDTATLSIGDSKEGWCKGLELYFELISSEIYQDVKTITIDYSYVRPEGERLKRFGGRASGYKSLKRMFEKINEVVADSNGELKTIHLLDIATIISENVVSGGVRRSAMMVICEEDDKEVINAKRNLYKVVDNQWIEDTKISHRKMSNNSVLYNRIPTKDEIKAILNSIRINGEPGFLNNREALRRKGTFQGCNPCGEILLRSKQCCNLSTNNLLSFVKENNTLDMEALLEVIRLSARLTLRMTLVDVELPAWNKVMQEDRIVGVSLTGMMDMMNRTGMGYEELRKLLIVLKKAVHEEGEKYCRELGIEKPRLMTTIKPEGTLSNLPGVSSGVHYSHAPYYIRRVRISVTDPLYKMIEQQGCYPVYNEVGQSDENCTVKVIEFPVKSPAGKTKYQVSALEQLNLYKLTMEAWTDHNTSITVHVRENEWEDVAEWLSENFDKAVGITFLPLMEETYPLLPYESTTKEDYEERIRLSRPVDYTLLNKLENEGDNELLDEDCESGACPVR